MSFIIAVLPVLLIGIYIYKKDREKESSKILFKLFLGGIVSCFPAILLGLFVDSFFPAMSEMSFLQLFIYIFVAIALIEELCKWVFLYFISYNSKEFDSSYDMIVYAVFVALGFACLENIIYVYDAGIFVGLLRAVTAVPGHVCDGILMGFYLSKAKYSDINNNFSAAKKYKFLSIFVPMITHGIYDFCLFIDNYNFILLFVVFVILLFFMCIKKVNDSSRNSINFIVKNKYCTMCGNKTEDNYCTSCGHKNN